MAKHLDTVYQKYLMDMLKDVNIKDLSQKTGISGVTLYSIRRGATIPNLSTYRNICAALGVDDTDSDELIEKIKPLQPKIPSGTYIVITNEEIYKLKGEIKKLL